MYKTYPSSKNSYLNTTRTYHFDHIKANYPSEGANTLNPTALPMEVVAISSLASWLPSDPRWSLRLSKRGPRSSSSTSKNDVSKLSGIGGNQIQRPADSKAKSGCPTSVTGATRNKAHAAQRLLEFSGSQCQGAWSAPDVQQIWLCWDCSQSPLY